MTQYKHADLSYFISILLLLPLALFAQYSTNITVAIDGSGDYTSIQNAVNATKSFPDKRITIHVKPGIYEEKVEIYAWNSNITLTGQDAATTIITWDDHFDRIGRGRNSTFHTATLRIRGEAFHMNNITVQNTAGPVGQAIALYNEADRTIISNCAIKGHQDALFADGYNTRQYYRECLVEGTTDFIFGGATAVFENCEIRSKSNSYITAASTPRHLNFGLVFIDCDLTAGPEVNEVYLGRPWRSFAKTAFVKCRLGPHIRPEGWHNWSDPKKEMTTEYTECGNTGPGSDTTGRHAWIKICDEYSNEAWYIPAILNNVPRSEFNFVD